MFELDHPGSVKLAANPFGLPGALALDSRVVNRRFVPSDGWFHNVWSWSVPARLALASTTGRWVIRRLELHVSTFLHPLAPPELPGFSATMGAVTPGRLALRLPREREHPLWRRPGLPALSHRTVRSFRLQPPPVVPAAFWGLARRAYRTTLRWPPFRGRASLGLRHWGAGSPRRLAESSLLVLRTNRSPPVASHPASRRRSYHWLQDARTSRQGLSPCGFDALTGAHPCRLARQVKQVGS